MRGRVLSALARGGGAIISALEVVKCNGGHRQCIGGREGVFV